MILRTGNHKIFVAKHLGLFKWYTYNIFNILIIAVAIFRNKIDIYKYLHFHRKYKNIIPSLISAKMKSVKYRKQKFFTNNFIMIKSNKNMRYILLDTLHLKLLHKKL